MEIHLLLDLTDAWLDAPAEEALLREILSDKGLRPSVARAICLVRGRKIICRDSNPNWRICGKENSIKSANALFNSAAQAKSDVLLLIGTAVPNMDALGVMRSIMDADPHFGFVSPRYADDSSGGLFPILDELSDKEGGLYPRRLLSDIPDYYLLPEYLAPCLLIRRDIVSNFGPLSLEFTSLLGAFFHYMCRARRAGFRTVLANRAVVAFSGHPSPAPLRPCDSDDLKLRERFPDVALAAQAMERLPHHRYEALRSRALSSEPRIMRSVLLDLSNLSTMYNGTSFAMLGLATGLHELEHDWHVSIMTSAGAATFHKLPSRFPKWNIEPIECSRYFSVGVRLSQPWGILEVARLHRLALVNVFMILDTIAWDTLYPAPRDLDQTWAFIAKYADAMLYDSRYTQDRFNKRFSVRDGLLERVVHFSFQPKDYVTDKAAKAAKSDAYVLLIGNRYDHKWLLPTVDLLTSAFPLNDFKVIGFQGNSYRLVDALESGTIPDHYVERLYANADVVIFPSLYEGFGFPVLKGLSYGKTVIARQSSLLTELADHYAGGGRLVVFEHPNELVEKLGLVLHGRPVSTIRLGAQVVSGREPSGWKEAAELLLNFLEETLGKLEREIWMDRDREIRWFG